MSLPPKGGRNKQHVLTDEEVAKIRVMYEDTADLERGHQDKNTIRKLATEFKVSKRTIQLILNRQRYEWVE